MSTSLCAAKRPQSPSQKCQHRQANKNQEENKENQKENITQILEVNTSEVKTVYFSKQPQKKRLQFEIETEEKG